MSDVRQPLHVADALGDDRHRWVITGAQFTR
jgi:hypothetical protein